MPKSTLRFRLFLVAINTLFIAACLLPAIGEGGFAYQNFAQLAIDTGYVLWMVCALPCLAALSLGWAGTSALERIVKDENALLGYCQLALVLIVNSIFLGALLSHEFVIFGVRVDVRYVHFLFCVGGLVLVYRKAIFGERLSKCCKLVNQWLAP